VTSRLVLDASAAIGAVRLTPAAGEVMRLCRDATLASAPGLFAAEVANGMGTYVAGDSMPRDAAIQLLGEALDLVDVFVPIAISPRRPWSRPPYIATRSTTCSMPSSPAGKAPRW
jgi:predicted nucleic acid-binding protein